MQRSICNIICTIFAMGVFPGLASATLLGTELSVEVIYQEFSSSPELTIGVEDTATVVDPGVEFPDLSTNEVTNPFNLFVVPVEVDAGGTYIELDYLAPQSSFAPGFFNGYKFTFESSALVDIVGAIVNQSVTTLGITDANLFFSGNELFVNVASLPYNQDSFARIDLSVVGGPDEEVVSVPEPSSLVLLAIGLIGFGVVLRRRYE